MSSQLSFTLQPYLLLPPHRKSISHFPRQSPLLHKDHHGRRQPTTPRPARMAAVPDDTAVDMLTFALSGPGIAAALVFLGGLTATLLSFAELGPRRTSPARGVVLLRVTTSAPLRVELAAAGTTTLRAGETVLRFSTREECTAAARALEAAAEHSGCDLEYKVYSAGASGVAELSQGPRGLDAPGSTRRDVEVVDGTSDVDRAIAEYEQAGARDEIDREWSQVVERLAPIRFEKVDPCKLCGGKGTTRCSRCGGAAKASAAFECRCEGGRVQCEWCGGSGIAV